MKYVNSRRLADAGLDEGFECGLTATGGAKSCSASEFNPCRRGLSARAYRALTANRGVHFPCLFQPAVAMPPRFQQTGTRKKYAAVSVLSAVVTRPGRNSPYPLIITARMNGTEGACS